MLREDDLLARLNLNPDRIRLLASLGLNVVAKIPGLVATFVILPLVSRSLGTNVYGELLSALALGSVFTLPFGGINAVGRRLLATAFGAQNEKQQADIFVTTTVIMLIVATVSALVMLAMSARSWTSVVFAEISLLPLVAGLLNTFDNLRASYNEHYVTALFLLLFQVCVYACAYVFGIPSGATAFAALTLTSPAALASLATFVVLLLKRPFLLSGHVANISRIALPAFGVIVADGAIAALLNLSVFWLEAAGQTDMAAWFGTFARLFQSFMSPVLLILFPVTTYLSMRWVAMKSSQKILLHRVFIVAGLAYGVAVALAMFFFGPLYIDHMFKLSVRAGLVDVLALSFFLGAIIAQKAYTMLLYAVSDARFVSLGTGVVSMLAVGVAALLSLWLSAVHVVDTLFFAVGFGVPVVILWGDRRYRRAIVLA